MSYTPLQNDVETNAKEQFIFDCYLFEQSDLWA